MKRLFTFVLIALFANALFAQLPNGSIAPDFTLKDLNGVNHHLYAYLDSGYTVVIDFSAVWCGPCWNYHNSGALENLYIEHGPAGMPGVSENTTDDVMVFFIEGDQGSVDQLNGIGSGTQGDWVEGTPYPILPTVSPNNNQVTSDYQIPYWPTVYTICPDRLIQESGQITTAAHYALAQEDCPPISNVDNDVRILELDEPFGTYCGNTLAPQLTIQNLGQNTLTSLDIVAYMDDVEVGTYVWEGELERFYMETVTMDELSDLEYGNYVFKTVTVNPNGVPDEDPNNDTVAVDVYLIENGKTITVRIKTDNYPGEISWDLKYGSNVIAKGGDYSSQSTYNSDVCVFNESCYTFTVYDSYGDGIPGGYAKVLYGEEVLVDIPGSLVGSQSSAEFCVGASSSNDFITYGVDFSGDVEIDAENHEIKIVSETNIDEPFVAEFTLSPNAIAYVSDVEQTSGVTENSFENDTLIYSITAENGDEQEWIVVLEVLPAEENDFLSYSIEDFAGIIDTVKYEIVVPISLVKGTYIPEFTLSEKATAFIGDVEQVSGETEVDFANDSVNYSIVAENGDVQDWLVVLDIIENIVENNRIFNVYPNPTSGLINIEGVEDASIELFNTLGEKVYTINAESAVESIAMDEFKYGIYFVKIVKGSETEVVRFIYTE